METIDNLPFIGNVADDTTRATIIIIIAASQLSLPLWTTCSPQPQLTRVQPNTAQGLVVYGKFPVITEKK